MLGALGDDEAAARCGLGDRLVRLPPLAIDVRLTPPRHPGRDDHDRKIETGIARQWLAIRQSKPDTIRVTAESLAVAGCSIWVTVVCTKSPVAFTNRTFIGSTSTNPRTCSEWCAA